MIFYIRLSIPIQTETELVLNKCLHYLVKGSHDSGLLLQYFYSMNGRIQWYQPMYRPMYHPMHRDFSRDMNS